MWLILLIRKKKQRGQFPFTVPRKRVSCSESSATSSVRRFQLNVDFATENLMRYEIICTYSFFERNDFYFTWTDAWPMIHQPRMMDRSCIFAIIQRMQFLDDKFVRLQTILIIYDTCVCRCPRLSFHKLFKSHQLLISDPHVSPL